MAELNISISKDRIAADILIAAIAAHSLLDEDGTTARTADELAAAFKTIRNALD